MVFVRDHDSEDVIRQALSDLGVSDARFVTGSIDDAVAQLASERSPKLLIVDLDGAADPMNRVRDLADVCEPGTGVIAIGEVNDIRLYRDLKELGIAEYYYKPLVRSLLVHTCGAILTGSVELTARRGGKLVTVIGVRGGAGCTTIAVATALHLAETYLRPVALLDLDLQFGDAALQMETTPSHALREALEHPERVDDLFLERGAARIGERLSVFAGLEPLDGMAAPPEAAVMSLLERILGHYRYLFLDVPANIAPSLPRLLHLPGMILLVSTGTLACARDTARWKEALGPNTAERTTLHILNKQGARDGLPTEEFVRVAGGPPDVTIPYASDIAAASRLGGNGLLHCQTLARGLAPLFRQLAGEGSRPRQPSLLRRILG